MLGLVSVFDVTADTVVFRTGERLAGKVISEEATKIIFDSKSLGRIAIERERIERIEREAQPTVPGFVQTPSAAPYPTNTPPVATTNQPAARRWFGLFPPAKLGDDWIQLKSGEWLHGHLYGMQNRKLEFDSDELDDVTLDWTDVAQVITPQATVSYRNREDASGRLRVDQETVTVSDKERISFPRDDLIGIAPGRQREIDYWSGKFNLGLNFRTGNTDQTDLFTRFGLHRRTPSTHLKLDYAANFSKVEGVESVNNHNASAFFDVFLTRRFFLRIPLANYYRDPFQNLAHRISVGAGIGYYLLDSPKSEWLLVSGPAYQHTIFESVQADQSAHNSTPALYLGSHFERELTKRVDLELDYTAMYTSREAGGFIQHAEILLETDLTRRLDLDLSLTWDRIRNPQADALGNTPKQDDFRLNVSLGVDF